MALRTKIILAVVGISASLYFYKCYKDYYVEYDLVKNELNKIEGIKIISIDGNPDLTLEDISATIEVKNGDTVIFSSGLTEEDFRSTESVKISRLNNWEFHKTGCSHANNWASGSLDVGQNSEYPEIRKLNIKNIKDAITHFDEINALLNNISTYPNFDTISNGNYPIFFQKFDNKKNTDGRVLKWAQWQ